jgi:hypothetical protein
MCSGTKLIPTQIPIQNDNYLPCRDEREENNYEPVALRASVQRIRLLSASSTAQIRRLFNDCHWRDRLNGVVADTAFHYLPTPELQHFDFRLASVYAQKRRWSIQSGEDCARRPQPIFEGSFRPQTIFPLENSDPFRTSLAPSNRVALNDCLLSSLQPMERKE